jgi:hypothetical protein
MSRTFEFMAGVRSGVFGDEVPARVESAQALGVFGQVGVLARGDWFVSRRGQGRFDTHVRGGRWDDEIGDEGIWKPVGGPQVGATMQSSSSAGRFLLGGYIGTQFWLEFDQEAHPFGRFDLDVMSVAYQDPVSDLRLFVPLPGARDRTSIWMRSAPGVHACEAYVPGVMP